MTSVQIVSKSSKLPLILLHGWGFDSTVWKPLILQLEPHYQIYLVDLPGFGKNTFVPSSYTFEHIASELFKELPDSATWLGWSLGGLIAIWTAIHYPEKVTSLVTIGSSPRFIADAGWPGIRKDSLNGFFEKLRTNHQQTLLDFVELQLRGSPNQAAILPSLRENLISNTPNFQALSGGLSLLINTDLRGHLHKIKCPSLCIFGQLDSIVPAAISRSVASLLPNNRCELINRTGHMPFLTHPDHVIELLNQFIKPMPERTA